MLLSARNKEVSLDLRTCTTEYNKYYQNYFLENYFLEQSNNKVSSSIKLRLCQVPHLAKSIGVI